MEKIGAWIYDPDNALFRGSSKHAALYEVFCDDPKLCDLHTSCGSCLLSAGMGECKFGRKKATVGKTKRARSYHTWMAKRRSENKEYIGRLTSLTARNRIFKAHDHWYLPYAHMTSWGLGDNNPLKSKWVPVEALDAALLDDICMALPRSMMGNVIPSYQSKEIPKFLTDLKMFYPELFTLLTDTQKARVTNMDYVGRQADLITCAPGDYEFLSSTWTWDGELLHGHGMHFKPCKGELTLTIKPEPGQKVKITKNAQVLPTTQFLD